MAGLQQKLDAIRARFVKKAPAEAIETMHRATQQLVEELARAPGLGVGDPMPSFRLPDQDGTLVDSNDLLARGPLVLSMYRGHW